jgi:hypothetical protein
MDIPVDVTLPDNTIRGVYCSHLGAIAFKALQTNRHFNDVFETQLSNDQVEFGVPEKLDSIVAYPVYLDGPDGQPENLQISLSLLGVVAHLALKYDSSINDEFVKITAEHVLKIMRERGEDVSEYGVGYVTV